MAFLSSTDFAIAAAAKAGTLLLVDRVGRFGAYTSIEDAHGLIEVALSREEADRRVASVQQAEG